MSTAFLAVTILGLGLALSPTILGFYALPWFGSLAAAAVLGGLMLTDFPLADSAAAPDATLPYLASRLRYATSRVEETKEGLKVRLGSASVLQVRARRTETGCRVTFRADLTVSGMTVLVVFLFLVPAGIVAAPAIVYVFLRARSFAIRSVAPQVPRGGIPPPAVHDDVSSLLVNGLAESHRLAAEAYEAEHDSYTDTQGLAFLGALFVWGLVLGLVAVGSTDPDYASRIATAFWASLAAGVSFGVAAALLVRQRFRPRLRQYQDRAERLRAAWMQEVARSPPEPGAPTAFELLAESSRAVPDWLDAIRRRGLSRDPASDFLVVAGVFWTLWIVGAAASAVVSGDFLLAGGIGLVGVGLTAGLVSLYRRWRRRWEDELAEELRRWTQRFDEARARIERDLQDL